MRLLAIVLLTFVGGAILNGILALIAMSGLEVLRASSGLRDIVLMAVLPISFILAGWGSARLLREKVGSQAAEEKPGPLRRWAPAALGVAALAVVVGGIHVLEYRAESNAHGFCNPALVGTSMRQVAEAAEGKGTDMLRQIRADEITVGFTGLPPFSRHMCKIEGKGGVVAAVKYFYLD